MMKHYLGRVAILAGLAVTGFAGTVNEYTQTNLTSDLAGMAKVQDPNLVNPWGLAALPGSPFWVSDNGTGKSTLYNGTGQSLPLVVTLAAPSGQASPANPTGIIGNATASFGGDHFLFATESGTINGWTSGTTAPIVATGAAGSVYKGLTSAASSGGNMLYAANFGLGRIDVYNSALQPTSVTGGFHDSGLPSGYAPFNVQNLGGQLYVTYAKTGSGTDETQGAGLGFVDVFDANGSFVKRLASQGALNAPWGLAMAPNQFGAFSGDLIVGNFGDGTLNAYDPATGTWLGSLEDASGNPISIPGLWGISFGNGAQQQNPNELYFTAGIPGPDSVEDHGLFGSLTATPEPGSFGAAVIGIAVLCFAVRQSRLRRG